jgi:short-subunit dehydrogenase
VARGTALITGASSGIGAELAKLCAAGGYDLVLVARRVEPMQALAASVARDHCTGVRVLAADLADPAAPEVILERLGQTPIDILINNAGFGLQGPYAETDWAAEARMIQVNVVALAHLTKLLLPAMLARRAGRILNVASTAAFVPGPLMAVYYSTKAFVVSLSLAIAAETEGTGVTVTALCPGPTTTGFFEAAGMQSSKLFRGPAMDAASVARIGYRAMMASKPEVIAGMRNRLMIFGTRFAPRTMLAKITRGLNAKAE